MKPQLICLWAGLVLSACSAPEKWYEFHSFAGGKWDRQEAVRFEVPVQDLRAHYTLSFVVRNSNLYPFRTLNLSVETRTPQGDTQSQPFSIEMADGQGRWRGSGVSIYTLPAVYQSNVQYPDSGKYVYTLRHTMPEAVLKGISDIGLKLVLCHGALDAPSPAK